MSSSAAEPSPTPGPDWNNWRSVTDWWFRPAIEAKTWLAAAYLAVGFLAALTWFVATIVVLSVALPLIIVAVGIPLTWLAFGLVDAMANVERRRALWVGVEIAPRPFASAPEGPARMWARLKDPNRWRQVAFMSSAFLVGALFFSVATATWMLPINVIGGVATGATASTVVLQLVFGVVMLGVAPRVTLQLARAYAKFTDWLLGPDPVIAMQQRVDTMARHRQEILDAVAEERRRIERNLHDGVQQRLVALGIDLGLAASKLPDDPDEASALIVDAREKTRTSIGELRVIGRGLHPAILEDRGLDAALSAVVSNAEIPITLSVAPGLRVPMDTEETAYFVAAEAVSNIMKHSRARAASVHIHDSEGCLHMEIHDDGRGGADMAKGSGLAGMSARVRGVDGRFDMSSPDGGPTILRVEIPHG